ncbi:MAG: hypothetical protein EOM26_04390 [Alphaproteobacteria bacterium]|nr:hypothetical protein [Alphaproteobacteria bacterium]
MTAKPAKPLSAVSIWTGIVGSIALFGTAWFLKNDSRSFDPLIDSFDPVSDSFCLLALAAGAMVLYDLFVAKVFRDEETGLEWRGYASRLRQFLIARDFYVKILGLLLSVGFLFFVWNMPVYGEVYYAPFFEFLTMYAPLIISVSVLYFVFVGAALKDVKDGFWHFGALLIPGLRKQVDRTQLKNHFLGLCIKAFFLPLMYMFFIDEWAALERIHGLPKNSHEFFSTAFHAIFFLDVALSTIGYVFTLRLLNAHVRWPDTGWGGWVVCLACYAPFNFVIFDKFIAWHDGLDWNDWIGNYPALYVVWGSAILACNLGFVFSTVNFGLRFSNLTHRGILTHGMYSLTKHPAYITKNVSWWLLDMPFLGTSFWGAVKNVIFLLLANGIYFLRARYEEKLLMPDPVYREYSRYIAEYGIFARILRRAKRTVSPKPVQPPLPGPDQAL